MTLDDAMPHDHEDQFSASEPLIAAVPEAEPQSETVAETSTAAAETSVETPGDAAPTNSDTAAEQVADERPVAEPQAEGEQAEGQQPADELVTDEQTADEQLDRAIAELGPAPASTMLPPASDDVLCAVEDEHADSAPTWPFAAYAGAWLAFAAFVLWRFYDVPADTALFEVAAYRWVVIGGIVLTALGPILAVVVWAAASRRPGARRGAMFVSAIFKAAIATFAGVCIWWASLLVLDQLRIGSLL